MAETRELFGDDRLEEQLPLGESVLPKVLEFKKIKFKKGLNFTVRIGEKWAKVGLVGKVLPIEDSQDRVNIGSAVITHIMTCSLADVPPFVFTNHHDPICKNPIILMDILRSIYGEEVNGASKAVIIGFDPVLDG